MHAESLWDIKVFKQKTKGRLREAGRLNLESGHTHSYFVIRYIDPSSFETTTNNAFVGQHYIIEARRGEEHLRVVAIFLPFCNVEVIQKSVIFYFG